MSAGAPYSGVALLDQPLPGGEVAAQILHALSPLAEVVDELRAVRRLLEDATPKLPMFEIQTLQTGMWWQAFHFGYQHLRLLCATAITINVDCDRIGLIPFALPAATVTEFYLPDKSKLYLSTGTPTAILVIWDDIS